RARPEVWHRIIEMTDGLQGVLILLCLDMRRRGDGAVTYEFAVADDADRRDRLQIAKGPRCRPSRHVGGLRQSEKSEYGRREIVDRDRMRSTRRGDVRTVGDEDARVAMIGKCGTAFGHL